MNPKNIKWKSEKYGRFMVEKHGCRLRRQTDEQRFWLKVKKTDMCWLWKGYLTRKNGYGKISFNKKDQVAHRVSWQLKNGDIPTGMSVLHKCDNPPCVNPDHLFLGTQRDNVLDMVRKKRHWAFVKPESAATGERHSSRTYPERVARGDRHGLRKHPEAVRRGENSGTAKLTEEKVKEIRSLYKTGHYTHVVLGNMFKISNQNICKIINFQRWAHVK